MSRFDAIFAALEGTGVRYIVVGGVAVNLHGYQRFTKDVDIVVDLLPEQTIKALERRSMYLQITPSISNRYGVTPALFT